MQQLLQQLGCTVSHEENTLVIDARNLSMDTMSGENVTGMRSSITLLGAVLGRCREVTMAYPGGCVIGQRPIDRGVRRFGKWAWSFMKRKDALLPG